MATEPRIDAHTEVVAFEISIDGKTVKAIVGRETLQDHFGADDAPASWLETFQTHRSAIEKLATDRYRHGMTEPVLVQWTDIQR
jgi:hypothetical protein